MLLCTVITDSPSLGTSHTRMTQRGAIIAGRHVQILFKMAGCPAKKRKKMKRSHQILVQIPETDGRDHLRYLVDYDDLYPNWLVGCRDLCSMDLICCPCNQ